MKSGEVFKRRTTLKDICNADECKFFYTKANSTPDEFSGLFHAAMMFREAKLDDLADEISLLWKTLPFWAVEAYKASERAFRLVEAEEAAKDPKEKSGADMTIKKTGSKAFALIEADAEAKRKAAAKAEESNFDYEVEAILEAFDEDAGLEDEIFDYFREVKNE